MNINLKGKLMRSISIVAIIVMFIPSLCFASNTSDLNILSIGREQQNYEFHNPLKSKSHLLLLVEIYTPEKSTQWKTILTTLKSLTKEITLIRDSKEYHDKFLLREAILNNMYKLRMAHKLSGKDEHKLGKELITYHPFHLDLDPVEDGEFISMFECNNEVGLIRDLNNMLRYYTEEHLVNLKALITAYKHMINNPLISKSHKYFDEDIYNTVVQEDFNRNNYVDIYDEDLLAQIQIYAPDKFDSWKILIDNHKKRANEVVKKSIDTTKYIQAQTANLKSRLKDNTINKEQYLSELKKLVKVTPMYNWYIDELKQVEDSQPHYDNVVGSVKVLVEADPNFFKLWDEYRVVARKVESALKSKNTNIIRQSLDELYKKRHELMSNDYFIIFTLL